MKPKKKFFAVVLLALLLTTQLAYAQPATPSKGIVSCGGHGQADCQLPDLVILIVRVINFFLGVSWIIALFFIFWGAYNLITAAGNDEKIKAGKTDFRNGVIGFFIVMIAFVLIDYVLVVFGGYRLNEIYKFIPGFR